MKKHCAWLALGMSATSWGAVEARIEADVRATELGFAERIVIDGRLDDRAWQKAQVYHVAFKFAPTAIDTQIPETTYRILVDGEFLYVGVDCRDPNPKAIRRELSHRDLVEGADSVKVWIDPDGRRKFAQVFKVAAGGAIWDGTHFEDS